VFLVGEAFWGGLRDWAADQLVGTGKITADELELLHVTDDLDGVVRAIDQAYDAQVAACQRFDVA